MRTALANNPQDVAEVFSGFEQQAGATEQTIPGLPSGITFTNPDTRPTYTKLGVLEKLGQLADKYIDSTSGLLTGRGKSIQSEIDSDNKRISDYDDRLAAKRTQLEAKFAALESTLAQMRGQQSALSGIQSLIGQ